MSESAHNHYLDELVNKLSAIDENKRKISWIMKDGIWLKDNSFEQKPLCDLILFYQDRHAIPVELKGSRTKKRKALVQLQSGKEFVETVLDDVGYVVPYGIFVVYDKGNYHKELIRYGGN